MDYQLIVVGLAVVAALAYALKKGWDAIKPGPKAAGCGCSSAASGCGGCPLVKNG